MAIGKVISGMLQDFKNNNPVSGTDDSKAFERFVNYLIISKYNSDIIGDIGDLEYVMVDDKSQFGLDAIAFIVNGNLVTNKEDMEIYSNSGQLDIEILFIQTKTEDECKAGDLLKTIEATKLFLKGDNQIAEKNENMINAMSIYNAIFEYHVYRYCVANSPRCHIFFVTVSGSWDANLISNISCNAESDIEKLISDIKSVEISVLGKEYIIDAYNEIKNRVSASINLRNCTVIDDKIKDIHEAYIGYITGADYLKIICDQYGDLRRRIFYENVRDYQGMDNSVNGEIRATIKEKKSRDRFVLLNNGVTIIAKSVKPLGANEFEIADFQIVNGCQTSNEIYNCKEYASGLLVPIKIVYTTNMDLINSIVRSTNRQSPVPEEAFLAMNKVHKELQMLFMEYSNEMPIEIFYERRSGESSDIRDRLNTYQIVTLHGLVRAFVSTYLQKPYMVYAQNPANILKTSEYKFFRNDHDLNVYFIATYLFVQIIILQKSDVLSRQDYQYRFYMIMIVRMLMVHSSKSVNINEGDKKLKQEIKRILSILKSDDVGEYFREAKSILKAVFYRPEYKRLSHKNIMKTAEFNQKVIEAVKNKLNE